MSVPGSTEPLLVASQRIGPSYYIERSIRFDGEWATRFTRTFGAPTSQGTFTFSAWVKRYSSGLGTLIACNNNTRLEFAATGALRLIVGGSTVFTSSSFFKDCTSWYHVVWAQAGSSHTFYVNNTVVGTATAANTVMNSAILHTIGSGGGTSFDGTLAEIHFIDGQALGPASFGESDDLGIWYPKAYSGSFGANGFKLNFNNNTNTTTIGYDVSGNNNHWASTNFVIANNLTTCSLCDSPTNGTQTDTGLGGQLPGNYCTLNFLDRVGAIVNNGGLYVWTNTGTFKGTIHVASGKWFYECRVRNTAYLGVANTAHPVRLGAGGTANSWVWRNDGLKGHNDVYTSYGSSFSANDIIGVAFDMDAKTLRFYRNGVDQGIAFSNLSGTVAPILYIGPENWVNFGQMPFTYAAPAGFKCLCTANIPAGDPVASGSFIGNGNVDGPVVWTNSVPSSISINGNPVTFGVHAERLASGFKVISNSVSYNNSNTFVTNPFTATSTGPLFVNARAQIT